MRFLERWRNWRGARFSDLEPVWDRGLQRFVWEVGSRADLERAGRLARPDDLIKIRATNDLSWMDLSSCSDEVLDVDGNDPGAGR